MENFSEMIARALKLPAHRVENTLKLLEGGATIPFISRYRKEATGGMDEVQIGEIQARNEKLRELAKRKETVLSTIEGQGKLTPELRARIDACWDATELEDIYLPYKPKRKTRAEMARQKGLEPLAALLLIQRENRLDARVHAFVKGEVKDEEEALKGARDIIAEQVSEDERARSLVRGCFARRGVIVSKVVKGKEADEAAQKYRDYFDFSEPLKRCSSHRLLALRRGEAEGILKVSITPEDDEECIRGLERRYVKGGNACSAQVAEAVADAYKRLLKPAIETEFSGTSKERAGYRDRVFRHQQGACRRGSHPRVCRKPAPAAACSFVGAEAGDGHRPRIPHGMQGGLPRRARRPALQRYGLSASAEIRAAGGGTQADDAGGAI